MNWYHKVDQGWLAARKSYLSASDIRRLLETTPTGRPRANIEEAYLKAWASKQCAIAHEDIESYGAMARGHLLEPYAIEDFNKLKIAPALCHWDDILVYSADGVSSSPDALDVPQPEHTVEMPYDKCHARALGEVKCYSDESHYVCGMAPKMTLNERWQIATAFHVIPTLEKAFLIFYNPRSAHPLFYHEYTRAELADELDQIEIVVSRYASFSAMIATEADARCPHTVRALCRHEDMIVKELQERQDIETSVIDKVGVSHA